jgi:hypothetical protein
MGIAPGDRRRTPRPHRQSVRQSAGAGRGRARRCPKGRPDSRRIRYDRSDAIPLERKDNRRERGIASPDDGDSLALTFAYPGASSDPLEEYGAAVLGHRMAADEASPRNRDHDSPESTVDLPPPNDLGHWRRRRAIIGRRRTLAVDPSYRASRETHSPVPCGAGLRAVDLGSCTGRRQGLLRSALRFLSQVCPEYEPTRRRRGVGGGRRLPERQSSDGHTGVGG